MLVVPPTLCCYGDANVIMFKFSKRQQCLLIILPLHAVNHDLVCDILGIAIKKKKKMQSRQGSSPPIVSALAPDLTKKRQGVNPWLLLYVYVLHTGYSKIGLLLAGQLHAQRQLVLLYQALFGQAWSETGYKPHIHARRTVLRVLDGQQQRNKAPEYQHSELRGREVSILVMFSLYVEYIKKKE